MARETTNGDLRTPISFFATRIAPGVDGRDTWQEKVFSTFAEVYNPSMKDIEVGTGRGIRSRLTLRLRDPLTSYVPDNRHLVEVHDHRYQGTKWQIVDIRPDFVNRQFLTVVLGEKIHD